MFWAHNEGIQLLSLSSQLSLAEDQNDLTHTGLDSKELVYLVQICCQVSLSHTLTKDWKNRTSVALSVWQKRKNISQYQWIVMATEQKLIPLPHLEKGEVIKRALRGSVLTGRPTACMHSNLSVSWIKAWEKIFRARILVNTVVLACIMLKQRTYFMLWSYLKVSQWNLKIGILSLFLCWCMWKLKGFRHVKANRSFWLQ